MYRSYPNAELPDDSGGDGYCEEHDADISECGCYPPEEEDMPLIPKPWVGEVVIYVAYGTPGGEYKPGAARPAIVTSVIDEDRGVVTAAIFQIEGIFFRNAEKPLQYDAKKAPGTWHRNGD